MSAVSRCGDLTVAESPPTAHGHCITRDGQITSNVTEVHAADCAGWAGTLKRMTLGGENSRRSLHRFQQSNPLAHATMVGDGEMDSKGQLPVARSGTMPGWRMQLGLLMRLMACGNQAGGHVAVPVIAVGLIVLVNPLADESQPLRSARWKRLNDSSVAVAVAKLSVD